MEFINLTGNTVFLTDINLSVSYFEDHRPQYISTDNIKKSNNFQQMVVCGKFNICTTTNSRVEKNLLKKQKDMNIKLNNITSNASLIKKNDSSDDVTIKIRGHFYDAGGYAKVNRNLAFGLNTLGCNLKIDPIKSLKNDLKDCELRKLSNIGLSNKGSSKKTIAIDSIIPSFSEASFCGYNILYTTIEAQTIPDQFVDACSLYNEIWVTSDFCKNILEKHNVKKPIFVIPDTVDIEKYTPNGDKYIFNPKLKDFVFLSVFGWSYRKGYDVLLKSYLQNFSGDDNVTLLIVSRYQYGIGKQDIIKSEIQKYINRYGGSNPAHIARCGRVIPEEDMPSLYRSANAFCLYSRAEGFCIPYIEASLCGIPVIGTNVSGQTMFLNKDNSFLLDVDDYERVEPGTMNVHYWDSQIFPKLKSEDCIKNAGKLMREVYENYPYAAEKNRILSEFVKDRYSIESVSKMAKDRLDKIIRENF